MSHEDVDYFRSMALDMLAELISFAEKADMV